MNRIDQAKKLFSEGYNCAQAIAVAFNCSNIDIDKIKAMTTGFGAGCGKSVLCGALSGGTIALGLNFQDSEEQCKKYVAELFEAIKIEYGGSSCSTILDCDITTEEGINHALANNLFNTRCVEVVEDVAKYLTDVLQYRYSRKEV